MMRNNSARTSQETNYVSVAMANRLMLCMEIIAVYRLNRMKRKNTFCGQNPEYLYNKADRSYSDHWALKL
jgi:hypothetical protein